MSALPTMTYASSGRTGAALNAGPVTGYWAGEMGHIPGSLPNQSYRLIEISVTSLFGECWRTSPGGPTGPK
jgi:hypothetical protein